MSLAQLRLRLLLGVHIPIIRRNPMPFDPELAQWSIEARHCVQKEMLNLYQCLRSPQIEGRLDSSDAALSMVGASFALWRAAFLVNNSDRNRLALIEKAKGFLGAVFETNIIGFFDDSRAIDWSGGFYLNNAGYRLNQLAASQSEFAEADEFKAFLSEWRRFIGLDKNKDLVRTADAWDIAFAALRSAIRKIMKDLDVHPIKGDLSRGCPAS
jgi:hypothetical protein